MVGLQDRTSRLPWDNFVSDEIDSNTHLHIDRFRESEWPNIVRELAKEPYNIVLPEGLEPHWVAPGKAVYWSELIVREVVEKEEYGISKRVLEDVSHGWFPVGEEHGLPDEEGANQYLQDVWYSHEGEGLANEYPEMVRARLESVRKGIRDMDRATAAAAKTKASPFPGKGGEVSITDGKTGGYKTPQDRADELWPMINPGQPE